MLLYFERIPAANMYIESASLNQQKIRTCRRIVANVHIKLQVTKVIQTNRYNILDMFAQRRE